MHSQPFNKEIKQMVAQYRHLFFLFHSCAEGDLKGAKIISEKLDLILKNLKVKGYDVGNMLDELKLEKSLQQKFNTVVVFTDGGVRNNHDVDLVSNAASSYVVYADQQLIKHQANYIGDTITLSSGRTVPINSTLAEYHGLFTAIQFIQGHSITADKVVFITDCATMVHHLMNELPQQETFNELAAELKSMLGDFNNVELKHVPRAKNKVADSLVNELLNMKERSEPTCR